MKKSILLIKVFPMFAFFGYCQSVTISTQVWRNKNLDVSTFRNGDPIPEAKTDEEWERAGDNKQPSWCYYDNDARNGEKYGKLYNWYAVNDPRGLAPSGWHVPSNAEWTTLTDYLGGERIAGEKMKSTSGWYNNGNGTNSSGFIGLPGGSRAYHNYGSFYYLGSSGCWWSSSECSTNSAWNCSLNSNHSAVFRGDSHKNYGFSVRCLKGDIPGGTTTEGATAEGTTTGEKTSISIGSQVWSTKNLDVSTFRNGDPIPQAKTREEWQKAGENKQPAWCYYNNDPANGTKYGKLYNWYAVSDPRGLAPSGWHVPSNAEWTTLTDYLGGERIAGEKMKSTSGWYNNGNGTNSSGFIGLPGGYRDNDGYSSNLGRLGSWWSSSEDNTALARGRDLRYGYGDVTKGNCDKDYGFSVRCLRD